MSAPAPPPGVERAELPIVAVLLKRTLSVATGAPGNCQFNESDQFVLTLLSASTPLQLTLGRLPIGPLVSVIRTAVVSGLRATVPVYPGGSVPTLILNPLIELAD